MLLAKIKGNKDYFGKLVTFLSSREDEVNQQMSIMTGQYCA